MEIEELYYVVSEKHKTIFELPAEIAEGYANALGFALYTKYPYEAFGYEDPYTFTNDWTLIIATGEVIKYDENFNEIVMEA